MSEPIYDDDGTRIYGIEPRNSRHPRVTAKPPASRNHVKQSFKEACDINHIMAQWVRTGEESKHIQQAMPQFGDFTDTADYREQLHRVIDAQESFDSLPARIRNRMGNNPIALMGFLEDGENTSEAIQLGLIDAKQALPYSTMDPIKPEETPHMVPLDPISGEPITPVPAPPASTSDPIT